MASTSPTLLELRDRAVAWMNRGHELLLRSDEANLSGALDAYNEAIALFRRLPVAENPAWANSFGAALMNRGQLLHRAHGVDQAALALAAFDEAATLLCPLPATGTPWPRRNLTGTFINRANLLLDLGQHESAASFARQALALSAPHERDDLIDADLTLKARRALGDALGQLLVAIGANQEQLAHQASDVVDEAFTVIRHWSGSRGAAFPFLSERFFRYGAQLYRLHQPHFLAEFITENLPAGDAALRTIALEAIDGALNDGPGINQFLTIGDPASERRRQAWHDLSALRARLAPA